jgi:polar amino acid transport system substrate-binding protein
VRLRLAGAAVSCALLAAAPIPAAAADAPAGSAETSVHVATLNWPPYTAPDLPRGGAVTSVVRAAFAQMDVDIEVRFWPWKRAIAKAKTADNKVVAYFPGYHCHHDPESDFVPSDPIGFSPLGFAEHVDAPQTWHTLESLEGKRIGTVVGYANTEAFDRKVDAGELRTIPSSDDATNLMRLVERRVDLAVVDRFVLAYLLNSHRRLSRHADELRFDQQTLEDKGLHLCFRNDGTGQRLRELFDRGLDRLDPQGMLDRYVERMVKG